jgi:hypothetical protein
MHNEGAKMPVRASGILEVGLQAVNSCSEIRLASRS